MGGVAVALHGGGGAVGQRQAGGGTLNRPGAQALEDGPWKPSTVAAVGLTVA